ncbi:MAG: class F sortase [Acidimicrobiia bacterium]
MRDAPVTDVGVEANGDMEVPGPREVGWYRYGAAPEAPGSTVLAAHIAFNGVDGVFRRLDRLDPGDDVVVTLDDGRKVPYVVTERVRLAKDALPARVFATTGPSELVLITCGGAFNPKLRSYEDNVIVYASPA